STTSPIRTTPLYDKAATAPTLTAYAVGTRVTHEPNRRPPRNRHGRGPGYRRWCAGAGARFLRGLRVLSAIQATAGGPRGLNGGTQVLNELDMTRTSVHVTLPSDHSWRNAYIQAANPPAPPAVVQPLRGARDRRGGGDFTICIHHALFSTDLVTLGA